MAMIVIVSVSVNMTNQILPVEGVPEEAAHRSQAKAKLEVVNRLKSQHCVVGLCVAVFVDVGIVTKDACVIIIIIIIIIIIF